MVLGACLDIGIWCLVIAMMSALPSPNVAVLMGGPSGEHEISLKSGHGVAEALMGRGWSVEPVVIPQATSLAAAGEFVKGALRQCRADVAFIALHGSFGEDGTIQRICEELRIAYTGSNPQASSLGMDKVASRRRFEEAGLAIPRWHLIEMNAARPTAAIAKRLKRLSRPLVVKPTQQGSSLGVSIVRQDHELQPALEEAARYGRHILIEEFVSGREMTVGVLGEEPLPIVEIRPSQPFFDFAAKYTAGLTEYVVPAPLRPSVAATVQAAGAAAHRALGCRHLSRADIILTPQGVPVVLEVNTIPGFTPTSLLPKAAACAGLSYEELCEQLVTMALRGTARRRSVRELVHL